MSFVLKLESCLLKITSHHNRFLFWKTLFYREKNLIIHFSLNLLCLLFYIWIYLKNIRSFWWDIWIGRRKGHLKWIRGSGIYFSNNSAIHELVSLSESDGWRMRLEKRVLYIYEISGCIKSKRNWLGKSIWREKDI